MLALVQMRAEFDQQVVWITPEQLGVYLPLNHWMNCAQQAAITTGTKSGIINIRPSGCLVMMARHFNYRTTGGHAQVSLTANAI